jgi:P pilus assembly chaperone PapD
MRRSRLAVAALALALLAAPPAVSQAPAPAIEGIGANLNISPKRVTLDRGTRTASVYIFNQGTESASFDIALVDRVMLPDGRIAPLDEALETPALKPFADRVASAKPMLLAAPRRVVLAPGKGQTIRVRAAPVTGLPPAAEYRSHLTVTTVPPREAGYTAEQAASMKPDELQFSIRSVFGVSIPIIVRQGAPEVAARVENARVAMANLSADGLSAPRPTPVLNVDVVRTGANSLFGDVEVQAQGRRAELIGAARGVGVYTEIDRRTVQVPLSRAPRKGERLEVRFNDGDASPGKLLAASELVTP